MITKNTQALNRKAHRCKVIARTPHGVYRIKSPSGSTYTVDLGLGGTCTCAWGQRNGAGCSHEMAARKDWARWQDGRTISFQAGSAPAVARKQRKAVAPIAVQGKNAVTAVLRDKVNPVAALDGEILALGRRHRALCHEKDMLPYASGPRFFGLRDEVERLRVALIGKQHERATAARTARAA